MVKVNSNGRGELGVSPARPNRHRNVPGRHVLIIAAHKPSRRALELSLPETIPRRSYGSAVDTEGLGAEVVVVGGDFPLAELTEVRAHPRLYNKPVVLFAPNKDVPDMEWESFDVWPVLTEHNAIGQLIGHIRRLFVSAGRDVSDPVSFGF